MDICLVNDDGYMPANVFNITVSVSDNPDQALPMDDDAWVDNTQQVPITSNSSLYPLLAFEQSVTLRTNFSNQAVANDSGWQGIVAETLLVPVPEDVSLYYYHDVAPCLRVNLTSVAFAPSGSQGASLTSAPPSLGIRLSFANQGWSLRLAGLHPNTGQIYKTLPGGQYAYVNLATQTNDDPLKSVGSTLWNDCSHDKTTNPGALWGDQNVNMKDYNSTSFVVCDAVATKVSHWLSESMQLFYPVSSLFT